MATFSIPTIASIKSGLVVMATFSIPTIVQ